MLRTTSCIVSISSFFVGVWPRFTSLPSAFASPIPRIYSYAFMYAYIPDVFFVSYHFKVTSKHLTNGIESSKRHTQILTDTLPTTTVARWPTFTGSQKEFAFLSKRPWPYRTEGFFLFFSLSARFSIQKTSPLSPFSLFSEMLFR